MQVWPTHTWPLKFPKQAWPLKFLKQAWPLKFLKQAWPLKFPQASVTTQKFPQVNVSWPLSSLTHTSCSSFGQGRWNLVISLEKDRSSRNNICLQYLLFFLFFFVIKLRVVEIDRVLFELLFTHPKRVFCTITFNELLQVCQVFGLDTIGYKIFLNLKAFTVKHLICYCAKDNIYSMRRDWEDKEVPTSEGGQEMDQVNETSNQRLSISGAIQTNTVVNTLFF